jgi:5-methylthioadenosine/S-adenosylhomocysteine deaminase
MIAVDLGNIETQPIYSVISHLVYASSRSAVTDVWVDGTQLLEERRLTTVDLPAIMASVHSWADKIREGKAAPAPAPAPAADTPAKGAAAVTG